MRIHFDENIPLNQWTHVVSWTNIWTQEWHKIGMALIYESAVKRHFMNQ